MEAENDINESSDTSSVSDDIPHDDIASPDPVEDSQVLTSNRTFLGEDDRSQTPLQDEVEGASQQVAEIAGGVEAVEISEMLQQTSQQDATNADDVSKRDDDDDMLKQTVRDDHGELDYDEEVQPDGCPVASTNGGSPSNTRQKAVDEEEKEDGEEKEEGEEVEEGEAEDGEKSTDGEIDDDDCEDGEIKDPGGKKPFVRPICRFFMRGNCTWGMNCRFLHPGINDKGNYTMLEQQQPPPPPFMPPMYPMYPPPMIGPGGRPMPPPPWMHDGMPPRMPRAPVDMGPPVMEPPEPVPAAPPASSSEPATESAWERGLRYAKEMRKKQKDTEVSGDEKKDDDDDDEKKPSSPVRDDSPPPAPHFEPVARPPGYDEGEAYARPPMPPPGDMWGYRPPFDVPFDPRWGRGMPPPFMPPPPDFRIPEHERARRYSQGSRYEPRRNPWYDRYPHDGPQREPGGPQDTAHKGRGDEWKDPWLRTRSPKRRRSSSRSGSRSRRRYRKGSYSSMSSSSYSSKSRSRSSSSSSYSSYSRSSRSQSSYSSRSSSSRSRSRVQRRPRKPVVSTFRRPLPDKKVVSSTVNTSSETKPVSQSETLLIGSGPLPARAPPEKKPPAATEPAVIPKISQPPPVSSAAAAIVPIPQPVVAPAPVPAPVPPPAKPVVSSASLPKLTQPLPLASRPPLPNVARGVAAAFLEQDDEETETSEVKTSTALVAQNSIAAAKVETSRPAASKAPAPVPPPLTSAVTAAGKSASTKSDLMLGLSGMSYSDLVLAAQMQKPASGLPYDRGDGKGLGQGHSKPRTSDSNRQASAKKSHPSGRHRLSTDSKGRKKLEIGRNVIGRPLSSSGSQSSSTASQESLSSLSSSGESEHLYRDIASDISSATSPAASPIQSDKPKAAKTKKPATQQSSVGSSGVLVSAQPKSHHAEKTKEKLRSGGRASHRPKTHDGPHKARREHRTSHHSHVSRAGISGDGLRTGPKEIPHEVVRDREREAQPPAAGHASLHPPREGTRRHSGSSGGHWPNTKHLEESRSKPVPSHNPPSVPHRLSSDPRPMAGHGDIDVKSGSGAKGEVKMSAKVDKTVSLSQSLVSSATHKRVSTFDDVPVSKVMRHASELKEPVKIPIPKFDRTQKLATATSPVRSSARPNQQAATALVAMAAARSPVKASLSLPLHPLSKPALMHPSLTSAGGLKRKSTSSRREELLMQLKAVEDAIAKKRLKMQ